MRRDVVWKDPEVVATFVHETRGGVPYGADHAIHHLTDVDCFFKVAEMAVFGGRKPEPRIERR